MPVSGLQQHHWRDFRGISSGMGVCLFVFLHRTWLTLDTDQALKKTFESTTCSKTPMPGFLKGENYFENLISFPVL